MGNYFWPAATVPNVSVNMFTVSGQTTFLISIDDAGDAATHASFRFRRDDFSAEDLRKLRDCVDGPASPSVSAEESSPAVYVQSARGGAIYVQDGTVSFSMSDVQATYPVEWFRGVFPRIIQLLEYDAGPWSINGACCGTARYESCQDVSAAEFGDGDLSAVGDTDADEYTDDGGAGEYIDEDTDGDSSVYSA